MTTMMEKAARAAEIEMQTVEMIDAAPSVTRALQAKRVARAVLMAVRDAGAPDVGYFETIKDVHRIRPGVAWSDMMDAVLNEKDTTND